MNNEVVNFQDIDSRVEKISITIDDIVEQANSLIVTRDNLIETTNFLKKISTFRKNVEEQRTSIVKPINDSVKVINEKYKATTVPLDHCEKVIKDKILFVQQEIAREKAEEERKRREEEAQRLRQIEEELKKENRAEDAEKVNKTVAIVEDKKIDEKIETVRTGFATTSTRSIWKYDVTDAKLLATTRPDLVSPNSVAINAAIKLGEREIPGLRIYEESILTVR